MSFQVAAVVALVLWIDLIADAWIIGYRTGRRDLKFYILSLVVPPAGLVVAIDTAGRRPPRSVPAMDAASDRIGRAPLPDTGAIGVAVMAQETQDYRDLVPVAVPSAGLDADGQALPRHDWWLPHRSTVVIDDTRSDVEHACGQCGLRLDPAWLRSCRHCGALFADSPPVTAS